MSVACLWPIQFSCLGHAQTVSNPILNYDITLGTPTAQGIVPPFTNLTAVITEIEGRAEAYSWDITNGAWVGIQGTSNAQIVGYTVAPPANPPVTSVIAVAVDPNGALPTMVWNVAQQTWK